MRVIGWKLWKPPAERLQAGFQPELPNPDHITDTPQGDTPLSRAWQLVLIPWVRLIRYHDQKVKAGRAGGQSRTVDPEVIRKRMAALLAQGYSKADAIAILAGRFGVTRSQIRKILNR